MGALFVDLSPLMVSSVKGTVSVSVATLDAAPGVAALAGTVTSVVPSPITPADRVMYSIVPPRERTTVPDGITTSSVAAESRKNVMLPTA